MATVVLDVSAAVPADGDRYPRTMEEPGLALRVIQEAVVRRVEASGDRQRVLDVHRDPVSEDHSLGAEAVAERDVPLRQVPQEECPARLEHPNPLGDPAPTPLQVLLLGQRVAAPVTVILTQVEWRVSEQQIHSP